MYLADIVGILSKYGIVDWLVSIIVLVAALIIRFIPFNSDFTPMISSDISNQLSTSTLSYAQTYIITFGIGLAIVACIWLIAFYDVNVFKVTASYVFGISASMLACAAVAKIIRRPRPDTIALCGGDGSFLACSAYLSKSQLTYQFSSFPSSESAEAMASAIFLCLYLGLFMGYANNFSTLLMLLPLVFGIFVSAACIWDRRNHIDDAIAGMVIGLIFGYISFQPVKKVVKQKKFERRPQALTETSSLPMPKYN
ncbi:PAP2 superfamily protein [Trichomonas vaginalis G3]|uniref:PAP2 superfamily protein n=1 Tax=Trichomonas vaginalis (strain ATCC PRA-98 / G3) TaxID=412133 RepID=A2DNA2_TRIV3|nr:phosphatidate phosphatase protein [Trichomonas vaginalis G3]EAY18090.1 PAP2 superfamily protein [Trichomonas vaginalis G3]KAI5492367.1 phosphatidate phosphatase protein [Trichomonas vaginalis G3]|eukprot:XP_001579076.1 PAP2 superfamily protein [Trichomonas vaginalis G3]